MQDDQKGNVMMPITIRRLAMEDGAAAADIFFDAVHNGTVDVYSNAQRTAWGGSAPNPVAWQQKFKDIEGFAADIDGSIVGFMTLDIDGYIDLAFVRSDLSGRGIGQSLYQAIEAEAIAQGLKRLTTQASKKAKPFFGHLGWQVDQKQVVIKKGISLTNFKMSKTLGVNS
jgi:putative acetyltransferase